MLHLLSNLSIELNWFLLWTLLSRDFFSFTESGRIKFQFFQVFKFEFTSDPAQMILSLKRSGISFLMILLAPPPVILCLKLQYLKLIKKIHKYQSSILGLSRNSSFWNRVSTYFAKPYFRCMYIMSFLFKKGANYRGCLIKKFTNILQ